jgi:opacity protein-like surface antigen
MLVPGMPANADDFRNWTGFYVGGHVGAMSGLTSFSDPDGPGLYGGNVNTPGFLAGVQLGYNWQVRPQLVLGLEAGASLAAASGVNTCLQSSIQTVGSSCKVTPREIATLTGRFGVLTEPRGRTLLFAKAGAAWMRSDVAINQNNPVNSQDQGFLNQGITFTDVPDHADMTNASISAWGATVGAGVEYALSSSWSLKMEYDYLRFGGMGMGAPPTSTVTIDGNVTNNPSAGTSGITQNIHLVKIGLNYRFGAGSSSERPADDAPAAAPFAPGWEFETGARYWYSSGTYRNANGGSPYVLVSQLTYDNMTAHSGELFGRVDAPFGLFVKGFIGGGAITGGQMYDEDWGLPSSLASVPTGYEITQADIVGSLAYLTGDIGYSLMRGRDHKVGVFVGYNMYQATMNTMGCNQLVAPSSGVCSPASPPTQNLVSQIDTWQSIRLGVSAEARLFERFKLGGDFAFLPYVNYTGLDIHSARGLYFPWSGSGNGVQAELIATYDVTDAFSIGVGGRYWAMWTNVAAQADLPTNVMNVSMDRYGVFLQASYKFSAPR